MELVSPRKKMAMGDKKATGPKAKKPESKSTPYGGEKYPHKVCGGEYIK